MGNQKKSTIRIEHEITPTSHKVKGDITLPNKAMNELGLATANLINTFNNCSERIINMFCNGTSVVGAPVGEFIKGKTAEIELAHQSVYAKLAYTKEVNMRRHLNFVAQEFCKKEKNGDEIPEVLNDTDNLLLIQDNASTTSDEDFLQLWAKLYTTEACKNGSVSRKAIKLCETLDADIVKVFESDIFPYCDDLGFYWGDSKQNIFKLLKVIDYGFMNETHLNRIPTNINIPVILTFDDIQVFTTPGYQVSPIGSTYKLTSPAMEIRNCLQAKITQNIIDEIIKTLTKSVTKWHVYEDYQPLIIFKEPINQIDLFILCKNNNVIYPADKPYKNVGEFQEYIMKKIEIIDANKN